MTRAPVIAVEHVGVRFLRRRRARHSSPEEFWPLKDITFDVLAGESLGIIGRNGAGKSTLLQALAGIMKPDRGTIRYDGVRRVSLLALNVGFISELSGRENAILSGRMLGLSRTDMLALIPKIIEFSELQDFIDDPVGIYSTGMVARLGFSVAIHIHADVLLIDEVLGVGDLTFQAKSRDAIEGIIKSNRTVILVSHGPVSITTLCNRALWIEGGVVASQGEPSEVVEAYQSSLALSPPE